MAHEIFDFQATPYTIANDNAEQTVYATTVGISLATATLYRILLAGRITTKAILPGTLTLKIKLDGLETSVFNETLLTGVTNSGFASSLDCWVKPDGATSTVALSGLFVQNGGDLVTPSGARSSAAVGVVDLTVQRALSVTVQFGTADVNNVFTRLIGALIVLTG